MIEKTRPLFTMQSKLKDIPRQWLQLIEPRITRVDMCWMWQGACDSRGEPVLKMLNLNTMKKGTYQLKRVVAELFYKMKKHYDVFHKCGNLTCLNPAHLYVTAAHHTHEDREKMVNTTRKNIADYLASQALKDEDE